MQILALALIALGGASDSQAQDSTKARLEKLEREFAELKARAEETQSRQFTFLGEDFLSRTHIHGYGEMHVNLPKANSLVARGDNEVDFHRVVIGVEHEFDNNWRFDVEVDFEHADPDDLELEYAYLEADIAPTHSFRIGSLLMPVGPLNEFHEPPQFWSVERAHIYKSIIPTTWQELGAGFAGQFCDGDLSYRAYVVTSLDATGFSTKDGIRGGRSKGLKPKGEDVAVVGRLEHTGLIDGVKIGGSVYYGGADQDNASLDRVALAIYEGDISIAVDAFEIEGVFTRVNVKGADSISTLNGETIGRGMNGAMAQVGYHVLQHLAPECEKDLVLFGRREMFDTNAEVPAGFTGSDTADRTIWTWGAAYYPIPNIVFKADYEFWRDAARNELGRVNFGFGFQF